MSTSDFISEQWSNSITPTLCEFVKIPNMSPAFDKDVLSNGLQEKVVLLLKNWILSQNIKNLKLDIIQENNRTPVLFMEIDASSSQNNNKDCVLLYGHADKQPPMTECWDINNGLSPYNPVIRDNMLYGRGAADDGYSVFAALTAIKSLQLENKPHSRCCVLIEFSEESGSRDLPFYISTLSNRIGNVKLVVCLDSGAGDYERLWLTTSLRGMVSIKLNVSVLLEGSHSGKASGIIPDSFRILQMLLHRIENPENGKMIGDALFCEIPSHRVEETKDFATLVGEGLLEEFSIATPNFIPMGSPFESFLQRTWMPYMTVVGADGFPPTNIAGNVLRPNTTVKLSIRIPPLADATACAEYLKNTLEDNPPYNASVQATILASGSGFDAPKLKPWLASQLDSSSTKYYGNKCGFMGEGGSIPFMGQLKAQFPNAQFVVVGVLGPKSNAHSGNEMLHLPYAENLTRCIADILETENKNN